MILSLSMLKMEKNFIAVIDKDYSRKPYQEYPIYEPQFEGALAIPKPLTLMGFVKREYNELEFTVDWAIYRQRPMTQENLMKAMLEVADVSNTLDYLFEGLLSEYHALGGNNE
ncbi:hypothetical protein KA005_76680 [bacterium]|nr:hypothetical protein [bacterium]